MAYAVEINRLALSALFDLKGAQPALGKWLGASAPPFPQAHNTASVHDDQELYWIGPDHWLFRAPLEREADLVHRPVPDDASVVLISDTLAFTQISGEDAAQIISIACPLDIRPSSFRQNAVTYTEAFGLKALLIRRTVGFELAVERSFADLLEDHLTRARGA